MRQSREKRATKLEVSHKGYPTLHPPAPIPTTPPYLTCGPKPFAVESGPAYPVHSLFYVALALRNNPTTLFDPTRREGGMGGGGVKTLRYEGAGKVDAVPRRSLSLFLSFARARVFVTERW